PNRMENFKHVDSRWVDVYWDPGRDYSVPWLWGTMAFAVNTDVYEGDIDTLALVFDPPDDLKGRIGLNRHVGDVLNAALRYLDLPRCSDDPNDLKKLDELLRRVRLFVKAIATDGEARIASGDVDLAMLSNGASMRARAQVPFLKYAYPKEGFTGWMDNVAVLKDAPNLANAKLFVNFIMAPENAALISNYAKYANGIVGSEKFMGADLTSALEIVMQENTLAPDFVPPCDEKVVQMYDKIWTNLIE
ncbi:MAG: extracellular solute-binding protein, partial [Gammaproteobacteria bacterium]|nr:extracellular solute-binding protein [Gammaproteobacteria bacterium]